MIKIVPQHRPRLDEPEGCTRHTSLVTLPCHAKGEAAPVAPRDQYAETMGDIKAKADAAPQIFAAESQYRPMYDQLELKSLGNLLRGSPGGQNTVQYTELETVPATYKQVPSPNGRGYMVVEDRPSYQRPVMRTKTVDTPASPGYLELMKDVGHSADDLELESTSRQRAGDIADVENLGPKSLEAMRKADPTQAGLVDTYSDQALSELKLGANMSPAMMRIIQQSIRGRQAGMLGGTGTAGDFGEAMALGEFGQRLQDSRRGNATAAVSLRSGIYGDAFNRVLGRPSGQNGAGALTAAQNLSRQAGPAMFGSSVNANDVADSNFNAANARSISSANNAAATQGAMVSGGAALAAAGITAAAIA